MTTCFVDCRRECLRPRSATALSGSDTEIRLCTAIQTLDMMELALQLADGGTLSGSTSLGAALLRDGRNDNYSGGLQMIYRYMKVRGTQCMKPMRILLGPRFDTMLLGGIAMLVPHHDSLG